MPNLNARRFSNPAVLRGINPDLLLAWLAPSREYFRGRGVPLPDLAGNGLDYEALGRIFAEPTPDMPRELVDSLFLVHEMATPDGMDTLLAGARRNRVDLALGDEPTPADVALALWMARPGLLETLHNCQEMTRPRAFRYFVTDADPVPTFDGPAPGQLRALEERLDRFYRAWKRGPGTRVFAYRNQAEWWFLVRHGMPCRREPALDQGRPTSVFYRPQHHHVLVYHSTRGELRVNCCAARERNVLLRAFGACLFGRTDFFPGTAKYTLAPLVRRGRDCLACGDIPGIERVRLTEVEFYFRDLPWQQVTRRADDIFELIEARALRWPRRLDEITRATFEVHFRATRRPRRLTIVPCNKVLYTRDEDSALLEAWMERRQFADPELAAEAA